MLVDGSPLLGTLVAKESQTGSNPSWGKCHVGRDNSFVYWKNEHEAIRNDVGMIDMSFMSKFLVQK